MPDRVWLSRRNFIVGTSGVAMEFLATAMWAQSDKYQIQEDYRDFDSGTLPDLRPFGTQPAKSDEVAKADALLLGSPEKKSPIDVMRYFEGLPDKNAENEAYNGGWRVRWNPLIVRFFTETKTTPAG